MGTPVKNRTNVLISVKAFASESGGRIGNLERCGRSLTLFNKNIENKAHFILFIVFKKNKSYDVYIMNLDTANRDIIDVHKKYWQKRGKSEGHSKRKISENIKKSAVSVRFLGKKTHKEFSNNFNERWSSCKEKWELLENTKRPVQNSATSRAKDNK